MTVFHFRHDPRLWLDRGGVQPGELRMVYLNHAYRDAEIQLEHKVACGEWVHVAVTHGDGEVVLYVNGKQAGEATYNKDAMGFEFFAYTWQYHLGCWYGEKDHLTGDLGPFRLHTRALTAEEVAQMPGKLKRAKTKSVRRISNPCAYGVIRRKSHPSVSVRTILWV